MGKSTGQIIGTVVGGIIGAFVGYPMLGASLGGMLGGIIDPPKGPDIKGPRLNDLSVQSSSYGQVIPRVYGTVALAGNVFWIENNALTEHEKKEEQGGKGGGGGATTTSYWYSSTFALGLCEGPIEGIRRIWVSGKLIYDAGSSDVNTIIASNMEAMSADQLFSTYSKPKGSPDSPASNLSPTWTLYTGSDTQTANPRMEATLGVGNVPGYRGLAYIVFEDFDLTNYGNSLMGAQFKVEVIKELSYTPNSDTQYDFVTPTTGAYHMSHTLRILPDRFRELQINCSLDYDLYSVSSQDLVFGNANPFPHAESSLPAWSDGFFEAKGPVEIVHSDVDIVAVLLYRNTPSILLAYDASGTLVMDTGSIPAAIFTYDAYFAAVRDGEMYLCSDTTNTYPIYKLAVDIAQTGYLTPAASPALYTSKHIGLSQNYVFTLDYSASSPTSCTVRRIKRDDLTLDVAWTQAVSGSNAMLYVESDEVVYTMSNQSGDDILWQWVSGVATDTGVRYSGTNVDTNRLVFASPLLAYVYDSVTPTSLTACFRSVIPEQVSLASIVEAECLKAGLITAGDIDASALTQDVRGYRITQVAAIRAGLEPLQGAWPFDVIQDGYKITFIPRGGSSVGTVTKEELGAAAPGETSVISITESREMDAQLARKAVITFLDVNREYDVSEQSAERLNTDAVNIRSIEMPLVLTADEGAQIVERLLYLWWLERRDLSFTLPPTWLHLQPADVVTIQSANATFEARITSCQYLPDGRIEIEAKYNDSPVYISTAVGAEPPYTGQTLGISGPTLTVLMDVPCMLSDMDAPGILAAACGYTTAWPGATLLRSDDSGQTWTSIQALATPGAAIGYCNAALASGRTDIVDATSSINVRLHSGTLASVSLLQMYAGQNHFAIGAHGRWEIVGAMTVTEELDGTYTLTDMLRGRFGTEWATGLHQSLDTIVLLDSTRIPFVDINANRLFVESAYRGITNGATIDSGADMLFTYSGENLECLSPAYVMGGIDAATKDWTVTWLRRTRVGGEWLDYVDAPLSEVSEAYEVDIYDSTFNTVKRTITGLTSATFTWTAAQQVTDFTFEQQTIYGKVYQMSDKVGRGRPKQFTMQRALYVPPDPYWSSVSCLLHGDGVNGTNNFVDQTGKTVSIIAGTPTHSTSSFKWSGASIYFNGTGGISMPRQAAFGFSGDASIEFWINPDSNSASQQLVFTSALNGTQKSLTFRIHRVTDTTFTPHIYLYPNSTGGTSGCITAGSWQFIQIIRSGNTITVYRNTTSVLTVGYTAGDTYDTYCAIGSFLDGNVPYKGYLDDFRITKGVARAAATPTGPFPDA